VTGPRFELFLARLYTDAGFRARFLADPGAVASDEGLTEAEIEAAVGIDREGLLLAAESFEKKRRSKK